MKRLIAGQRDGAASAGKLAFGRFGLGRRGSVSESTRGGCGILSWGREIAGSRNGGSLSLGSLIDGRWMRGRLS